MIFGDKKKGLGPGKEIMREEEFMEMNRRWDVPHSRSSRGKAEERRTKVVGSKVTVPVTWLRHGFGAESLFLLHFEIVASLYVFRFFSVLEWTIHSYFEGFCFILFFFYFV